MGKTKGESGAPRTRLKASEKAPPDEAQLKALVAEAVTLGEEAKGEGAWTAVSTLFRTRIELTRELAKVQRERGSEPVDATALIESLPKLIESLPESAFKTIAQAVDERRRGTVRRVS